MRFHRPAKRFQELGRQILDAHSVEALNLLVQDVDRERAILGENAYRRLRSLAAKQMDKVSKKKLKVKVGPADIVDFEKEGKLT